MKFCLTLSASIVALSIAPAMAEQKHCEFGADTLVTYVTTGNSEDMQAGAGQRVLEFIASAADPALSAYEYRIINGENGDVIQHCGMTSEKSRNWLKQRIALPGQRAFMEAAAEMPASGNYNMIKGLHAGAPYLQDGRRNLLFVDAPKIYDDPREPGYSFKDGHMASDGMFGEGRLFNPFSVEGLGGLLAETEVYIIDAGREEFATAQHQAGLDRFWASYTGLIGGEIKALRVDAGAVLSSALKGHNMVRESFSAPNLTAKPDMLALRPVELSKVDISTEVELREMTCFNAPVDDGPQALRMSLVWEGENIDLDLYARARGGELSYRNVRTTEGWFEKTTDKSLSGGLNGYEIVGFHRPVDISAVSIWVNVYTDRSPSPAPIAATIKGTYGSRCFSVPVTFPASRGDRGSGRASRQDNGNWVKVELTKEQS